MRACLATMLLLFLLQLLGCCDGSSEGSEHETLCTSGACFTLHMERANFEEARQNCVHNGGYLMTVRDREEEAILLSLLSRVERQRQDRVLKFWIGLRLHKGDCVLPDRTLRGFKWVSAEQDSQYSNWDRDPVGTCTEERCVRVLYAVSGQNLLKWVAGPCKTPTFYTCKFYFKGMCPALALLGAGRVTYMAPFSTKPQRNDMKSLPLGTYADILCSDLQAHYSVCMAEGSSYRWTAPGPFCEGGTPNCAFNNGGCDHECSEIADGVRCACQEGFKLEEDGHSCRIKDVCVGNSCDYRCVPAQSGYSCVCPAGFYLDADGRSCADVDECAETDCERCVNTAGSFSCHCGSGFSVSADGRACVDVDECVSSRCEFQCRNTPGSFVCLCPELSGLEPDGLRCSPADGDASGVSVQSHGQEGSPPNATESLSMTTEELQHQSPHTDAPFPLSVGVTHGVTHGEPAVNASAGSSLGNSINSRVLICVLGSVIPLLALLGITVAIAIYRCSRNREEAKKKVTTDGYCWVSSGLDPRLEKLYESILTDDL